jgi:hypothetical protein
MTVDQKTHDPQSFFNLTSHGAPQCYLAAAPKKYGGQASCKHLSVKRLHQRKLVSSLKHKKYKSMPNTHAPVSKPPSSSILDFSAAMAQIRTPKTALATTSAME